MEQTLLLQRKLEMSNWQNHGGTRRFHMTGRPGERQLFIFMETVSRKPEDHGLTSISGGH
jgi:hypothetical protein